MIRELQRIVCGKRFAAALMISLAAIAAGTDWAKQEELSKAGQFLTVYKNALSSKTVCYLLPVAALLPWSDSFLQEFSSGFLKEALPRQGRRNYVEIKILGTAVSGFLVWIFSGLLALFGTFVLFFPREQTGKITWSILTEDLQMLLRLSLVGASLAILGGIFAVWWRSSYLAFGIPFVGYYFCIILKERYFPDALWLYPPQWITGAAQWGENGEGLWIFLLLLLGVTAGIYGALLSVSVEEV